MKKLLITVQLIFALIFGAMLMGSFFVVEDIQDKSRDQITEKVVQSISSKLTFAEEVLNSKAASNYLKDYQIETIREEINSYKSDPSSYVESVVQDESKSEVIPPLLASKNPLKNLLLEKIFSWKKNLKNYFNKTFDHLVFDIRLFITSNIVALLGAAFACYRQSTLGKDAIAISTILTIAIALSSIGYLDQNWFYSILLNSYAGYGYPLTILSTTAYIYYQYYKNEREA